MQRSVMMGAIDILDPLREAARRWPEAAAVVTPERTISYGDLDRLVTATAARLRASGGSPAPRVGLFLPNGWPLLVLVLAALRAGAVACPISTRLPVQGVAALLRQAGASWLVADDAAVRAALAGVVAVRAPEDVVREAGVPLQEETPRLRLDRPATVVFTTGSTGLPKAALHSVGNHYFSARGANENIALGPGDRWLLVLPLYHVGGLGVVFRCLLAGAAVVVPAPGLPTGAAMARYGVTHASLVATQLGRLLRETEGAAPEAVKALLVGGSAVPPSLIREAYGRGWPVHTTYGLTETASQVTTTPPGASLTRLGTSGRCLPYRRLTLADDGEILVRGEVLFLGYVAGEALHRPVDAAGWFHTGDVGALDAEGFLRVLGRLDHLFISGGENIQPEEIERALCALDGVQQAVVVPVDDATFGQRPVAFVQRSAGGPALERLAAHLEALLPRFKIPLAFYEWPDEDPSNTMKLDRAFFRRQAARRHDAES